jgi:peptide deformylase
MDTNTTSPVLPIAQLGQPVLRQRAAPVPAELLGKPELLEFVGQMLNTLQTVGGVGLAAPQVFMSQRIFLAAFERPEDDKELEVEVFVNPQLTSLGETRISAWEGCLSFPELNVLVPRYQSVRVRYLTPKGEERTRDLTGFAARVVQHENDHLDGILTLDRIVSTRDIVKTSEMETVLANRKPAPSSGQTSEAEG